ncbi:MAG: FeoB-associated Cys-rich membrane protein [Bacteroidales bacterium]|nr:FeoB-associated Cys-rich membrane protein [Bacteroidales bacterium]
MNWQNIIVILIVAAAVAYAVTRVVRRYRKAKNGIVDCGCGCGADCPYACQNKSNHDVQCENCSSSRSSRPAAQYPASVLEYYPAVGFHGIFKLKKSVAHLLSLVSDVNQLQIEDVVIQKRGIGQYRPWYRCKTGGGAIVLGRSPYAVNITLTENWFEEDAAAYQGHGYGQNTIQWIALLSHEVGHIPHIGHKGGLVGYALSFLWEYIRYGHDKAPRELEADKGYLVFKDFYASLNATYKSHALRELLESELSEQEKISTLDQWWEAYQLSRPQRV